MGESIAAAFFEPIIKRITVAVRRNVFPSLGITVALTVVLVFMLLNPWFGSQRAKFFVITYMMGGADDVEYVLRQTASDSNSAPSLIAGAARAGFYKASDRSIVDQWSEDFAGKNIVNQRKLDARYAAILAAREKAETHQPPFQPIGLEGIASSPSCDQTRPTTGQIYVRAGSFLATHLEPGDSLKIIRKDGLGKPVVGTVNKVPDMPKDVDIYLNRVQMIEFLESTAPTIAIRAVVTDDRPNQNTEDKYPSDVNISCRRG